MKELEVWKQSPARKPLVIKGARQCGKTWLMQEFGRRCYQDAAYFSFDRDRSIFSLFDTKDPGKIIDLLSILHKRRIEKGTTLIIFDELQECPEALNSLKYFQQEANEYHIVAAGSLLGTHLSKHSYPVGKLNLLNLQPLTFDEFLAAADSSLYEYYMNIGKGEKIPDIFHKELLDLFDYYLITGGMPECVSSWIEYKDPARIAQIQSDLLELYESDITKHNDTVDSGRILLVYRSIVGQLAKPNEKFMYGVVKESARAREFEGAIEWLVSAALVNRCCNVSRIEAPLRAYEQKDAFKLYLADTGLLKHYAGIEDGMILLHSAFQFKGPLTENYVLQQLKGLFVTEPCYYSEKNHEIDFLIQLDGEIIPIEVKSGENIASPSLTWFRDKYHSSRAIRYSRLGYQTDGGIVNIPLYLAPRTKNLI